MPGQRAIINCRHHVSIALCIYEIQNIILDTTIYWTFHRSEHQGMAKKHLNLLLLHCGTASSKSYMQIKRAKTVAEYLSFACRTATISTIPGLH
jgi:hypothetical protein